MNRKKRADKQFIGERHHKKANKRTTPQIAADLKFCEHWHVRGKTDAQLAEMLAKIRPYTLSRQQVNADLQKLRAMWEESAITKRGDAIARELAGLQAQEDELWEAWEKSKLAAKTRTVESSKEAGEKKSSKKERVTTEEQCGEAQFQKLIADIRVQRRQLLGLDAPAKIQPVGDDWMPQEFIVGISASELPKLKPNEKKA